MHEIDFLPAEYRERHRRSRQGARRLLWLGCVAAVLAGAAIGQEYRRQHLRAAMDMIEPVHAATSGQAKQLGSLQSHLQAARATAELVTYLRHPWPRTRILDEVLRPLPDALVLQRVSVERGRDDSSRGPKARRSRSVEQAEEARLAGLPPPTRDLHRLRQEADLRPTVVEVSGTTEDSGALHRYLAVLEKCDLFAKVELQDVETSETQSGLRFHVMLVVRPGYGQKGGPTPAATEKSDGMDHPASGVSASRDPAETPDRFQPSNENS